MASRILASTGHIRASAATGPEFLILIQNRGELVRFESGEGRARCGELYAHSLDSRRLFFELCCEDFHRFLLLSKLLTLIQPSRLPANERGVLRPYLMIQSQIRLEKCFQLFN
jgi:hypothetical protein